MQNNPAVTETIHDRKRSRREIEGLLSEAGARDYHRPSFCCPFHNDAHASAAIRRSGDTGAWYFYCYTCGINDDVWDLEARITGRSTEDVLRDLRSDMKDTNKRPVLRVVPPMATNPVTNPRNEVLGGSTQKVARIYPTIDDAINAFRANKPQIVIEEVNRYTNPASGIPDLATVRYIPEPGKRKQFLQISPSDGGWVMRGLTGNSLPLFNRSRLDGAQRVIVVEGEKCVRALTKVLGEGWAAVTCPGGAKSGLRADWSPLSGKAVYVWPDNDEPGLVFGQEVADVVSRLPGCRLFLLDPAKAGLGPKEDAADVIDPDVPNEVNAMVIGGILETAEEIKLSSDLRRRIDLITSGAYAAVPFFRSPNLTRLTQALLPGKVVVLCGEPGAGKTFWVLENLWMWVQQGIQVSANFLEEDLTFYQQRALAQMAGEARALKADWVAENPAYVTRLEEKYRDDIEELSKVMICSGSEQRTIKQVSEWVAARAAAGDRIIIVDPVTAAHSETPAKDDLALMMAVKRAAEQYMCSVILVTHPRIGKAGKAGLDGMAGGAAYPRFAQTVLWLRNHESSQKGSTYKDYDLRSVDYVRAIEIWKARDGTAAAGNRCIAVELRSDSVRFEELGVVIQDGK